MGKNKDNYKFQLTIDSDSVLISQAPEKSESRVILANLQKPGLKQIAKSITDAGLEEEFIDLLNEDE